MSSAGHLARDARQILGYGRQMVEVAFERIELHGQPVAQAVLADAEREKVARPVDRVGRLLRHAADAVAHVGHHFGDGSHRIERFDAVGTQEIDPRQHRAVGLHLVAGCRQGLCGDELPHQLVALGCQQVGGQVSGLAVEARCGAPRQRRTRAEKQRVGPCGEERIHVAVEHPRVEQGQFGRLLHGGVDGGARRAQFPPDRAALELGVVAAGGDRVGGGRHLVGGFVIETAREEPHACLLFRERFAARIDREFQQRAPCQQRQRRDPRGGFKRADSYSVHHVVYSFMP